MKGKSIMMLAVALGCGLVAMIGVQQVLSKPNTAEEKTTIPVLVALQEISPLIPLDDSMVTFKEMPEELVPEGAVTSPEQYVNRGLLTRAFPGTMILEPMLGEEGNFHISNDIPEGMRVAAIAVTAKTAVAGFVQPKDRVDIQVTYKRRVNGKTIERTKTVLEYVEVFAVDKQRELLDNETESIYKNITVLVTPEQVDLIRFAESKGELNFSLRHKDDKEHVMTQAVGGDELDLQAALFGDVEENPQEGEGYVNPALTQAQQDARLALNSEPTQVVAEPVEAAPETWTIVIYHGGEKTVEEAELPQEPTADATDGDNIDTPTTEPEPAAAS